MEEPRRQAQEEGPGRFGTMKKKAPKKQPIPLEEGLTSIQPVLDALWSDLAHASRDNRRERILFISPEHGAGTTTLATATALGLARNLGEEVALIEANCYTPAMAGYLGLPPSPGITDVLASGASHHRAVRNSQVKGLYALTAGSIVQRSSGELATPNARELLERATRGTRFTVIDAPPILPHPADARHLLQYASKVVLVLQARHTSKAGAKHAIRVIEESEAQLAGVILNRFQSDLPFGLGKRNWR